MIRTTVFTVLNLNPLRKKNKLKEIYISQSWLGLSDAQFDEIEDSKKLVRLHTKFISRWLSGDAGHNGFIDKMSIKTDAIGTTKNSNDLRKIIKDIRGNMLSQNEISVLDSGTRLDYEKGISAFYNAALKASKQPDTLIDAGDTKFNDMRMIQQGIEINKLIKLSKIDDAKFNSKLESIGISDELMNKIVMTGNKDAMSKLISALPESAFLGNDEANDLLEQGIQKYGRGSRNVTAFMGDKMRNNTKAIFSRILLNDEDKTNNVGIKINYLYKFIEEMNSPIEALYFKNKILSFYDYKTNKPDPKIHENIRESWNKIKQKNVPFWEKLTCKRVDAGIKRAQLRKDQEQRRRKKGGGREYL